MKLMIVVLFTAATVFAFTPLPQDEEKFVAAMKIILPTSGSLRKGVEAKDAAVVKEHAAKLEDIFKTSEEFWEKRKTEDAIAWSKQGKEGAAEISKLAANGEWEKIPDVQKKIQSTCSACHTAHREKLPEGGYKIK
jgi:cytochrome c556